MIFLPRRLENRSRRRPVRAAPTPCGMPSAGIAGVGLCKAGTAMGVCRDAVGGDRLDSEKARCCMRCGGNRLDSRTSRRRRGSPARGFDRLRR